MSLDKITADEALISTDVDGLIRTVAERKRVLLGELQQLCKIDKKNMDKWIRVLEDEGYVSIEYGLRGTYVLWNGEAAQVEEPQKMAVAAVKPEEPPLEILAEAAPEEKQEKSDWKLPFASQPEPDPEELLSRYLAKKTGGDDGPIDNLKTSILTSLDEEKEEIKPVQETEEPALEEEPKEEAEQEHDEFVSAESQAEIVLQPEPKPAAPKRTMAADARELVSAYMDEINKEKAELEKLKRAKATLYKEKFAAIEGKMEADLIALTETIIEKQNRITELKERVLELPDKVDEVGKLQEELDHLRNEGRSALQKTREKVDGFLESVAKARAMLKERTKAVDELLDKETGRIEGLERVGTSVDARLEKIRAASETVREQIGKLNDVMDELSGDLDEASNAKVDIDTRTEELKQIVATHGSELESLEAELEEVSKIEHWVKEYVIDYEKKMGEIEEYVAHSEDDLADLREASESLYMNKYLAELESLTDAYKDELHEAVVREEEIDQKMAQSKARISELVRDSQQMIKKLRTDPSLAKDFGSMRSSVREKAEEVKETVEEKEQERVKLVDESRTARKTKVSGKVKAKARPVSKAKKKKRK